MCASYINEKLLIVGSGMINSFWQSHHRNSIQLYHYVSYVLTIQVLSPHLNILIINWSLL